MKTRLPGQWLCRGCGTWRGSNFMVNDPKIGCVTNWCLFCEADRIQRETELQKSPPIEACHG